MLELPSSGVATKHDLKDWVLDAVADLQPTNVVGVSKWIWQRHEHDLRQGGDLFYTWQYDLRWAAQVLRDEGKLAAVDRGRAATWRLASLERG